MRIRSFELVEVVVPAKPGVVNSAVLEKPLHKMSHGVVAAWSLQFDELPKQVILAHCDDGTVGISETLRDPDLKALETMLGAMVGADIASMAWQNLPWPKVREYDAIETLVLDLMGKYLQRPVSVLLGGALRDSVHVGAWSGHRTPEEAAQLARAALESGMDCLKLKCDLEDDVVGIAAAVFEACGPRMKLIFDPNERFEELRHALEIAHGLEAFGNVLCLEDPLPRWDLNAYAELRRRTRVPVAVHVALGYATHGQRVEDVVTAFKHGAADIYNLSAGVADFVRMGHIADAMHVPYWHGSEVDLGILEASYIHAAAASRGCVLPSDVFGRSIREHDLLAEPLEFKGSVVAVPIGSGLGVSVDLESLSRYETGRRVINE